MIDLKVKDMNIATGGLHIVVLNERDAQLLDLHWGDRVKVQTNGLETIAIVDIAVSGRSVPQGSVGLFEETISALGLKTGQGVAKISLDSKPMSVSYIKKKLEGGRLSYEEFYAIIDDIAKDRLTDIEMTYFVSACFSHELNMTETVHLTNAMVDTGDVLEVDSDYVLDKHCVGGVAGNRTSILIVPILSALGFKVPKTSSRSITSPAGTADTVEVLCNVTFDLEKMQDIVNKVGGCLAWGGAMSLAPADDKIIRVEHPISLDPTGQLLASIMAKKKSVSTNHLLIDIPYGRGAKMPSKDKALNLKKRFASLSKKLGIKTVVITTDGSAPIGKGIGPALEAKDVLYVLANHENQPMDLREKSIEMAGILLDMTGKYPKGQGAKKAKEVLDSGLAYKKFKEMIHAQGGNPHVTPDKISVGKLKAHVRAEKSGKVTHVDNKVISRVARIAGAPIDKGAGLYLHKNKGDKVTKGDLLFTIYAHSKEKLTFAVNAYKKSEQIEISK